MQDKMSIKSVTLDLQGHTVLKLTNVSQIVSIFASISEIVSSTPTRIQ